MLYQLSYASRTRMERETGIEPATNSLEGCDSTIELLPLNLMTPCGHILPPPYSRRKLPRSAIRSLFWRFRGREKILYFAKNDAPRLVDKR